MLFLSVGSKPPDIYFLFLLYLAAFNGLPHNTSSSSKVNVEVGSGFISFSHSKSEKLSLVLFIAVYGLYGLISLLIGLIAFIYSAIKFNSSGSSIQSTFNSSFNFEFIYVSSSTSNIY